MALLCRCVLAATLAFTANALPAADSTLLSKRQYPASPTVDLGYEVYQGTFNSTTGINNFLGSAIDSIFQLNVDLTGPYSMRYAQSTEGKLRWQAPQQPLSNRDQVLSATSFPQRCPQGGNAPPQPGNYSGTEDCLFLSVQAPANASSLPILVSIRKWLVICGNSMH